MTRQKDSQEEAARDIDVRITEDGIEDAVPYEAEVEEAVDNMEETEALEEATDEDSGEDMGEKSEKKGLFSKVKKEKKDKKDLQIEELNDKYKRVFAEFDNFRKRTEKEKSQMYEIGAKDVVEKILPVVDSFERGLQSVTEEEMELPFMQGMDKVFRQLMKSLEEIGVKPIDAIGVEFNPDFHNAVMRGEDENYGENIISEEFQKGYMYRDSVVRHSMVKVVNC